MKELVERIKNDGRVLGEGVLKVDSFITHQVDPELMEAMGNRFAEVFAEAGITKVITIIDDILANGQAAKGLVELCQQAGAKVEGIGIVIEKSFQDGRQLLEDMGLNVVSLARIASLSEGTVTFLEEDA